MSFSSDLEGDDLDYRRAKDKADKSLELNKFYVNALYVAMTRAVVGLTIVETDVQHPLLSAARPEGGCGTGGDLGARLQQG